MSEALEAQRQWAARTVGERLLVLGRARALLAEGAADLVTPEGGLGGRLPLEVLTSEVLPLLAAMRFLEDAAEQILQPRRLGRRASPLWMRGVYSEVRRVALGRVLVIGPSNYPLFLPGVQAVQALAAGNAVLWKPGTGGATIAQKFAEVLRRAGLPEGLLSVTDDTVEAAQQVIAAGVDKVFLTGSASSGRALLHQLADTLTPCVVELSGCDAVIVLPGADMDRVVRALTFGMRLNGSCTCMAPRRLFLVGAAKGEAEQFQQRLLAALQAVPPVPLAEATRTRLDGLLADARARGAVIHGEMAGGETRPILVGNGSAAMAVAQADMFAPVLTLIAADDTAAVLAAQRECPYALTASIFGPERAAMELGAQLEVGSVFVNDLIFPTADPRVPFSGRRLSGFGVTQGAEGLLEMTAAKTISVQRSKSVAHYGEPRSSQVGLMLGVIRAVYAGTVRSRVRGMVQTMREGRQLRRSGEA